MIMEYWNYQASHVLKDDIENVASYVKEDNSKDMFFVTVPIGSMRRVVAGGFECIFGAIAYCDSGGHKRAIVYHGVAKPILSVKAVYPPEVVEWFKNNPTYHLST